MTREEAKQIISDIDKAYRNFTADEYKALEMAIQALSQEPCAESEDNVNNLCNSCTNIGCEFQSGIVRTKCAFYMPPHIEFDNCGNYVVRPQEPMRDATPEEQKSVNDYIKSISTPTGFNVFDEYGNYKYPSDVELTEPNMATSMPCDDAVSRQAVLDQTYLWSKDEFLRVTNPFDYLRKRINSLQPVTQKPNECEDAISREWLKTAIHNFYYGLKHIPSEEDIQAYIDAAPSVTQKSGKWIPFSERLPEEEIDVLVCNSNGEIEISAGTYSTEANDFMWYTSGWRFGKVIAWMPLPKPYKPQERSK